MAFPIPALLQVPFLPEPRPYSSAATIPVRASKSSLVRCIHALFLPTTQTWHERKALTPPFRTPRRLLVLLSKQIDDPRDHMVLVFLRRQIDDPCKGRGHRLDIHHRSWASVFRPSESRGHRFDTHHRSWAPVFQRPESTLAAKWCLSYSTEVCRSLV